MKLLKRLLGYDKIRKARKGKKLCYKNDKEINKDIRLNIFLAVFVIFCVTFVIGGLFYLLSIGMGDKEPSMNIFYVTGTIIAVLIFFVGKEIKDELGVKNHITGVSFMVSGVFNLFVFVSLMLIEQFEWLTFDFTFHWWYILLFVGLVEVLYWFFDKQKPNKNDNQIKFTAVRKGIGALKIFGTGMGAYVGINYVYNVFKNLDFKVIVTPVKYVIIALLILAVVGGAIYGYLWLNSLKYKRGKK